MLIFKNNPYREPSDEAMEDANAKTNAIASNKTTVNESFKSHLVPLLVYSTWCKLSKDKMQVVMTLIRNK